VGGFGRLKVSRRRHHRRNQHHQHPFSHVSVPLVDPTVDHAGGDSKSPIIRCKPYFKEVQYGGFQALTPEQIEPLRQKSG
jgi:hypothetical protein